MGVWSRIIDSDTRQRYALAEIREGLFVGEGNKTAKLTQFWVLLVLSSFIAAGGVIGNSTPSVIGAMIIAPLATPIYGVALATTIGNTKALRNSLLLLVSGIAVNILVGTSRRRPASTACPWTRTRRSPDARHRQCST